MQSGRLPDAGMVDPAFAELLADPRVALRRPPPDVSMSDLRAAANRFFARAPRPNIHASIDLRAEGPAGPIALRLYRPSLDPVLPLILFIHGGGFVFGNLNSHDAICRTLANETGAAVAAVDYRLAPEWPFPAPLDDCRAALDWLMRDAGALGFDRTRVAVAGDSAGGQLAIALALSSAVELRHLALFYPLLDPARGSASAKAFADGYMLTGSFLDWAWEAYGAQRANRDHPLFDIGQADPDGLPPTTLVTAEFDPLRDEGEDLARRLEEAGVDTLLRRYGGMIHGFAGLPHVTPVANEAIGFVADRLRAALAS